MLERFILEEEEGDEEVLNEWWKERGGEGENDSLTITKWERERERNNNRKTILKMPTGTINFSKRWAREGEI